MMIKTNEVWMVRHTYLNGWFLPGGGLKRGETLDQAARREAYEETGADLKEIKLIGIFTNFDQWKTDHTSVFLCSDFNFKGKPDGEIAEVRSFALSELPADMYSVHRGLLEKYSSGSITFQTGQW
ncbi:MAG: NUDIX domain-containing protein [Anaerolineales bacterium]|nr:NUDIX domain-containing protein [Anaerolineales bacterium]